MDAAVFSKPDEKGLTRLLYALPYSLAGFFTLLRCLEIANIIYFQPINRLTTPTPVHFFITGTFLTDDVLIVILGIISSIILFSSKRKILYLFIGTYAILMAIALALGNSVISVAVALSIFPSLTVVYFALKSRLQLPSRITRSALIITIASIFLAIELVSILTWIAYPISPSKIYSQWYWYGADIDAELFYIFGLLSPALMALNVFSYGIRPGFESLRQYYNQKIKQRIQSQRDYFLQEESRPLFAVTKKNTIAVLGICVVLIILLTVYPYLPSINKGFQVVSVDTPYYLNQITAIQKGGLFAENGPFSFANERLLSILVFYGITALTGQPPVYVMSMAPILLNSMLVFSVYFIVRYALGKHHIAVLVAPVLTVFSTQFIVGIYGGFFSNMLALPLLVISLLFYLRFIDSKRSWNLAVFAVTLVATLLMHVYTWAFLVGVIALASGIYFAIHRKEQGTIKKLIPIALILVGNLVVLFAVASLVRGNSGVEFISNLVSSSISPDYFATRWFNLNFVFRIYLGGFLTNSVLIILALVWAIRANYRSTFNIVILSSMFVASIFFFIGDEVIQSRMLYNILLTIPAGILLAEIAAGSIANSLDNRTRLVIICLVILHFSNYGLRSLANMITPQ